MPLLFRDTVPDHALKPGDEYVTVANPLRDIWREPRKLQQVRVRTVGEDYVWLEPLDEPYVDPIQGPAPREMSAAEKAYRSGVLEALEWAFAHPEGVREAIQAAGELKTWPVLCFDYFSEIEKRAGL